MKKTHIFLALCIGLLSCGHPESYRHNYEDLSGIDKLAITYMSNAGEVAAFNRLNASFMSSHFSDSVELIIVSPEHTLKFPPIAEKYFNLPGDIRVTTNTYHDFFPKEWYPLKTANNYLTYHFFSDETHLFFIVYDLSSGKEIGSYFEYE
jgi:hypothetical protein